MSTGDLPCFYKFATVFSPPFNIHKADDDHGGGTDGKQKREPHPVVLRVINDGLDHVRADYGRLENRVSGLHGI